MTRTYRGAHVSWRPRSHAWTVDGRIWRSSIVPRVGRMWTRSRLSTASRVDGSNVWHESQSVANSTNVTRPAAGSMYPPVSLVASMVVRKCSASALRLKFLLLLAPSGVRQRARQPSRTRSTDAISAPHGWPARPQSMTGMRGSVGMAEPLRRTFRHPRPSRGAEPRLPSSETRLCPRSAFLIGPGALCSVRELGLDPGRHVGGPVANVATDPKEGRTPTEVAPVGQGAGRDAQVPADIERGHQIGQGVRQPGRGRRWMNHGSLRVRSRRGEGHALTTCRGGPAGDRGARRPCPPASRRLPVGEPARVCPGDGLVGDDGWRLPRDGGRTGRSGAGPERGRFSRGCDGLRDRARTRRRWVGGGGTTSRPLVRPCCRRP